MVKGSLLAFAAGWILWFWIDKNPALLGPLPYPSDGDILGNFQAAVNLLKETRIKAAFVYIWKAHYILLSLASGALIAMIGASISRALSRKRLLKLYVPDRKQREEQQ
jgi:hypothetical protein